MERFDATLDRIERRLKEMLKEVENVRLLRQHGPWTALQAYLLRLEDKSERLTLLTRALPCYTGFRTAADDVEEIIRDVVPVELGFTAEGWFCLRIPMLLPRKEHGSVNYIRGFLYPAMSQFFSKQPLIRYPKCVIIYRHVYARDRPERQYRDHDNIEINFVSDAVALSTAPPPVTRSGRRSTWCRRRTSSSGSCRSRPSRNTVFFCWKTVRNRQKKHRKNRKKSAFQNDAALEGRKTQAFQGKPIIFTGIISTRRAVITSKFFPFGGE